ncbi:MAG: hypothetical protein LBN22_03585 [Clostridiales Family XIII bacterium]|nr:hypothetical protein [Clostridiales Family XIII bacterium]
MTIKERLRDYRGLGAEIESLEDERDQWVQSQTGRLPHAKRSDEIDYKDDTGDIAAMIERKCDEIDRKRRELYLENERLTRLIDRLPRTQRTLIRNRYMIGKSWRDIADKIGYSLDGTYKLHRRALEKLEKLRK